MSHAASGIEVITESGTSTSSVSSAASSISSRSMDGGRQSNNKEKKVDINRKRKKVGTTAEKEKNKKRSSGEVDRPSNDSKKKDSSLSRKQRQRNKKGKGTKSGVTREDSLNTDDALGTNDSQCDIAHTSPGKEAKMEEDKLTKMENACKTILECIGEDPARDGLVKTPERWAKALLFMTKGYKQTVEEVTNEAIFAEDHREMVVVRDIDIHSLCEHHMVPFTGKVHVGYIPNGKILGLSKIARIAEVFARRLQVQERLTREIAEAIVEAVNPLGVAVVVECKHFCMVMRGVEKCGASTITSSVRGCFEKDSKTRAEFFSIINNNRGIN